MFCISLGDPDDNSKVWLELKDEKLDFNERKYKKCEVDFIESAVYKVMKGSQFLDCTSTTGAAYIVHRRVVDALCSNGVSGFDSNPIEIFIKNKSLCNKDYCIMRSIEVCSRIDKSVSRKVPCSTHPNVIDEIGFGLDMNTVNTDFVRPDKSTMLLCNQKVKGIIEGINPPVTGINFTHISERQVN
jgi:hypothetical protein